MVLVRRFLLVVLSFCCLVFLCSAVLLGRIRHKGEPGTNVVETSRFLYPSSNDKPLCKTDNGLLGRCVDIRFCFAARRAVVAGNHPIRCGWVDGYVPKVCCHPDQVQHPKMVFAPYQTYDHGPYDHS